MFWTALALGVSPACVWSRRPITIVRCPLYAKLGFTVREPLAVLQGKPLGLEITEFKVRQATERDRDACNKLCRKVDGHDRSHELLDAVKQKSASVVEHASLRRIVDSSATISCTDYQKLRQRTRRYPVIDAQCVAEAKSPSR